MTGMGGVVWRSWGGAYDAGYSAGRADALESGVAGLLEEIERYRKALAVIGKRGKRLPDGVARRVAREALDRTAVHAGYPTKVPGAERRVA